MDSTQELAVVLNNEKEIASDKNQKQGSNDSQENNNG